MTLKSTHARHSALNLGGSIVPILVGLPCMGVLARLLEPPLFSLLMLSLALIGYAGVLDLGFGRAVVALVAADPIEVRRRQILSTALAGLLTFGLVAAVAMALAAPAMVALLGVEAPLVGDAIDGFRLTAWAVPPLLIYIVVQGYLDGIQDFREANIQRIISGSLPILLATAAAGMEPTLEASLTGLLIGRILVVGAVFGRGSLWRLPSVALIDRAILRRLIGFGGWLTVSGVVGPLMGYLDRFILAFARGPAVVGFYAAPAEAIYRLLVLPMAVTRSLFPKLASRQPDVSRRPVLVETYRLILLACLPLVIVLIVLAPQILHLWLGAAFRAEATDAMRILAAGFLAAALAQVPHTRLLAAGRPDVVALMHLAQLLPFLAMAYYFAAAFGVTGAATAWAIRNLIDVLLLNFLAGRYAKA